MKKLTGVLSLFAVTIILIALVQAAAPPSIPVQGVLTDSSGVPLEAGGIWRLTAHYDADTSTRVVGYTRCGARCFN